MAPAVSIILPTYNREAFLTQAFASIQAQTFRDWRLIVVDDGSTDGTRDLVERLAAACPQPVEYVFQENKGAASARNAGIVRAQEPFLAFFDSDDLWMPAYLERSVRALEANGDVDWVFGPCRIVDLRTSRELEPNTFTMRGRRRLFFDLEAEAREGELRVIVDPRVLEFQLRQGMSCGAQNSVFRRSVLENLRFIEELFVVEDQALAICALAHGHRLAYFQDPQVIYRVHGSNWSFAGAQNPPEEYIDIFGRFVRVMDRLRQELPLTGAQAKAFDRRRANDYFWQYGYNGLWQAGRRGEALRAFVRSLSLSPWDRSRWKTFLLASVRAGLGSLHP